MRVGDKVICVDKTKTSITFGETYTIQKINKDYRGDDICYLEGIDEGFFFYRFRSLEEMQNTNFISIAKKE
jgi:hypothetical protein